MKLRQRVKFRVSDWRRASERLEASDLAGVRACQAGHCGDVDSGRGQCEAFQSGAQLVLETLEVGFTANGDVRAALGLEDLVFDDARLAPMYGMSAITPVINPPQAAILGVGSTRALPAVVDGELSERHVLTLRLSCDHCILYGADAAQFLAAIGGYLERPLNHAL